MKKALLIPAMALLSLASFAQKKTTTSATVNFDATTPKDDLPKATNNTVIAALNTETGTLAFEAQVKSFNFTNVMIQEHFNGSKWLNSEEYPVTSFSGEILDAKAIKFSKDGDYSVQVKGQLTLHGASKDIFVPARLVIKGGKIMASAQFSIQLSDYNIENSAKGKVSDQPKISVSAQF